MALIKIKIPPFYKDVTEQSPCDVTIYVNDCIVWQGYCGRIAAFDATVQCYTVCLIKDVNVGGFLSFSRDMIISNTLCPGKSYTVQYQEITHPTIPPTKSPFVLTEVADLNF